jgi:hypothetical protein
MPRKSGKAATKSQLVCACFALHTYDGLVSGEAWHVSTFVCTHCGAEHFTDAHPRPRSTLPRSRPVVNVTKRGTTPRPKSTRSARE